MNIQGYRDTFYTFSGKASDLNRQLAFAAIALIWLFKRDIGGQPTIPRELVLPGLLVVASLALDMVHYCVAALIWRAFYRSKEKADVSEDEELWHSPWLESPIWGLFVVKISCVLAAYAMIGLFLERVFMHTP